MKSTEEIYMGVKVANRSRYGIAQRSWRGVPPLLLALILQFAPLLRVIEPMLLRVIQPAGILLRWMAPGAIVAGTMHALSGATGIVSASSVEPKVGEMLFYRFQVNAPATPKLYTGAGLPPGLTLNRLTGFVTGVPTTPGVYQTQLTAWRNSTAIGDFYTATVVFHITGDLPPPTEILAITPDRTVHQGEVVRLEVQAAPAVEELEYQWRQGDNDIPGGTGSILEVATKEFVEGGEFSVRVLGPGGPKDSDPVRVIVVGALETRIPRIVRGEGLVEITFTAIQGRKYILEHRLGLEAGEWQVVGNLVASTAEGKIMVPSLPVSQDALRLFRLRVEPHDL